MNKHKIRRISIYILLAFVIFLYLFSIAVFLFGDKEAAIYVFAYSTFFTIIVYFLVILQRRLQNFDPTDNLDESHNKDSKPPKDSK